MAIIYFAHPIDTYGTVVEDLVLGAITRCFPGFDILDPNAPEHEQAYQRLVAEGRRGMDHFEDLVRGCQASVVLPFSDGALGAGTAKEARVALDCKSPLFLVGPDQLRFRQRYDLEGLVILGVDETRERLGRERVPYDFEYRREPISGRLRRVSRQDL